MNNIESKYKVGDIVRVKSLEWYNSNKDKYGIIVRRDFSFSKVMSASCGKDFEIHCIYPDGGIILKEDAWLWSDWMFEEELSTKEQQVLEQIERVQVELDKLRALCNSK